MQDILNYIGENQFRTGIIVFALLIFVFVITHRDHWKIWYLGFLYRFPFIGKLNLLSKDIDGYDKEHKWFYSEEALCHDYFSEYQKFNKNSESYEESKSYLYAVDELGRAPTPPLIWILIFGLVVIEALGFSYVLSGFTIPGASESTQQKGAIGVAFLISTVLVWFTHMTGQELHKNALIMKIRRWYHSDNKKVDADRDLKPEDRLISIDNTIDDQDSPKYIQMLNRLSINEKVKPSYIKSILTLILILSIAGGATYIRGLVLEQEIVNSHKVESSNMFASEDVDINEMFGETETVEKEEVKEILGVEENIDDITNRHGSWATYAILGMLFVFIQILGVFFGMHWGFVGRESKAAYKNLRGFSTKKDFLYYYSKRKSWVARIAQRKLQKLQQRMNSHNKESGIDTETSALLENNKDRTFKNFVKIMEVENV